MICSEPSLSELDDQLADLYKQAIRNAASATPLRVEQRQWLQGRNRCIHADCIKRSYELRIGQLSSVAPMAHSSTQTVPVCAALEENSVVRVPFPLSHALLDRPCWRPVPGLARIDVDNDGHAENLVRVSLCFRNCDSTGLAVADDTRTRAPETPLNSALASVGGGCGEFVDIFSFEGRAYVEASADGGPRTVYLMLKENPVPQQVCTAGAWR
jgi:hypothetical protein